MTDSTESNFCCGNGKSRTDNARAPVLPRIFLPRGIRNNNPGNLRLGRDRWLGQKAEQADKAFVEFTDVVFGLRALLRTLQTYFFKYSLDTVESIINRFAPPHENATDHYIHHVTKELGVGRQEKISLGEKETLLRLAKAIVRHENGAAPDGMPASWYQDDMYETALALLNHRKNGE